MQQPNRKFPTTFNENRKYLSDDSTGETMFKIKIEDIKIPFMNINRSKINDLSHKTKDVFQQLKDPIAKSFPREDQEEDTHINFQYRYQRSKTSTDEHCKEPQLLPVIPEKLSKINYLNRIQKVQEDRAQASGREFLSNRKISCQTRHKKKNYRKIDTIEKNRSKKGYYYGRQLLEILRSPIQGKKVQEKKLSRNVILTPIDTTDLKTVRAKQNHN